MPENNTRTSTVSKASGKGKWISPARYPPTLPAETTAYGQPQLVQGLQL